MALSVGKPWHKEEICLASELLSVLGAEFRGFWFPVWEGAKKRSVGHGVWKKKTEKGEQWWRGWVVGSAGSDG